MTRRNQTSWSLVFRGLRCFYCDYFSYVFLYLLWLSFRAWGLPVTRGLAAACCRDAIFLFYVVCYVYLVYAAGSLIAYQVLECSFNDLFSVFLLF